MAVTHKSVQIRDQIAADLAVRLSSLAGVKSFSVTANHIGEPVLTLGTVGTSNQQCLLRVEALPAFGTDILGTTQQVYAQHVVKVVTEDTAAVNNVSRLTMINLLPILGSVLARGAKVEMWMCDSGQSVLESAFAGTNAALVATWDPSLEYPLSAQ